MKKASEYRLHAEECRALARTVPSGSEWHTKFMTMAETWDRMAAERSELVRRHPELSKDDEHAEELAHNKPPRTSR